MEGIVAALAVAGVLLALWVAATRRHTRRRDRQHRDWETEAAEARPQLWTSAARCPHCRADGGLLDARDGELWFTCLACGQRHRRQTRA